MDKLLAFTRLTGALVKAMRACPQPIIAAVDGICAGAGAILAMASDLRLGTARSKVAFLFTRVGLSGADMGACAMLPRIIGQGRASELLYTGRFMDGEEAERWGFFNRLVEPDSAASRSARARASLADGPTFAHGDDQARACTRSGAWASTRRSTPRREAQAICMQTEDFARAYRAFVAKQTPRVRGQLRCPTAPSSAGPSSTTRTARWRRSSMPGRPRTSRRSSPTSRRRRRRPRSACGGSGRRGWLRYAVPKAYGGVHDRLDVRSLCLIRETLARHAGLADFAFAMQGLGSGPISQFGSDALKRRYLPGGRHAARRSPPSRSRSRTRAATSARCARSAQRDGDGFVIDGEKTWISNAGIADHYVVFCRFPEGGDKSFVALVVDADEPGTPASPTASR